MKKNIISLIIIPQVFLFIFLSANEKSTDEIMPFVNSKSNKLCRECHANRKKSKMMTSWLCDSICYKCHKNMNAHHKVGVELKKEVLKEMKLPDSKKLSCITCHDLKKERFAGESYASETLYESIFRSKSKYKTYYLIMRNNNGQLCKICH